jgi:uncharacterized protein (DUF362 family)
MAVSVQTVETYDRDAIKDAVSSGVQDFGGFNQLLDGKQKILLKPNFLLAETPDKCSTTHPEVYLAVAELLQDFGKTVTIGDSPAFGSAQGCVKKHGAWQECKERDIDVISFGRARLLKGVPGDKYFAQLSIAAELGEFDAVVNIPKLKVHCQFAFTGATKNLFGCVTGKRKTYRHFHCGDKIDGFARMILKTAKAVAPVLNIGDGILALHRNGPRNGEPYPLQTITVSDDYLEHDWYVARRIGLDPGSTPLFDVVPEEEREQLQQRCQPLFDSPEFSVPQGFEQAQLTPIAFTFGRMLRSVWKSIRARSLVTE